MAVARPRTLKEARTAYQSNSELAWWIFMRISGLLMVIVVTAHLYMMNIMINVGDVDFAFVSGRLSTPWVKVFDTVLIVLGLLHGANGMRYSIEDYNRNPGRRMVLKLVLYTVTTLVMLIGLISLWAIDYSQYEPAATALRSMIS